MREELKTCPFCGSTEVYVEEYEHHPGAMRWRVLCAGCMAGIDTGIRQSMGQAVQDWNHRAERTCRMVDCSTNDTCVVNRELCNGDVMSMEFGYKQCSECGAYVFDCPTVRYCPSCGARVEVNE